MEANEDSKRNDTTNSKILGNIVVFTGLKSLETKTNEPPEQHILPLLEQNKGALTKSANLDQQITSWKSSLGTYNLSQGGLGIKYGPKLVSSKNIDVASSYASSEKPFNDSQSRIAITDFNKLTKSATMAIERGMALTNSFSDEPYGGSLFSSSSSSQTHKHSSSDNAGFGRNINKDLAVKHSSSIVAPASTSPFQPSHTKISSSGGAPNVSPRIEALPCSFSSEVSTIISGAKYL